MALVALAMQSGYHVDSNQLLCALHRLLLHVVVVQVTMCLVCAAMINGHAGNQAQSTTPYGPWSQVISSAQPFSSFPEEEAFNLLGINLDYVEKDDNEFQLVTE